MRIEEYAEQDAVGLAALVAAGEVTAAELVAVAGDAIAAVNPRVNAVVETWDVDEGAIRQVAAKGGPLAGVPFLLKDIGVAQAGRPMEMGSRLTQGLISPDDSRLGKMFTDAGLVSIGRTAVPEWAWNTTTESALYGVTRNPWDLERTAGGSSGGAAAAVAAGAVPMAHGTDAAGSIRIPAASCGLFGLKPSRGRVSNGPALDEGLNLLASQLGISRSVRDSAALLDAVCGYDIGSPFNIAPPGTTYRQAAEVDPRRLRIGVRTEPLGGQKPSQAVVAAIEEVAELCAELGHQVEAGGLDPGVGWETFVHDSSVLWVSNLATWIEDAAAGFGRPVDETTLEPQTLAVHRTGRETSAMDLVRALDARNRMTRAAVCAFEEFDILLTPTLPDVALPLGTQLRDLDGIDGHGWTERLFDLSPYTPLINTAGLPAMNCPLSMHPECGLPIGSQFVAAPGREDLLFQLAGQLERSRPWQGRRPPIWAGTIDS
ncbi:amidase [Amycolatopsis sp. NPDC051061]|uniref:amidase n=1 Tax=Amycolatopsis sp. NPDC051061 TaxID=3155042 RepID=UPI00343A9B1C